jgi:hypothetical protein
MALTKITRLYAVKCGSTVFDQLGDATLSPNVQGLLITPPGGSIPLFSANVSERPDVSFSSAMVETILGLFGMAGGSAGITKLIGQEVVNLTGPTAIGSGAHSTWQSPAALGYVNAISASNRSLASAQVMLRLLRSGATPVITYAGTATITEALTGTEAFVMGPVVIDGDLIEGTNDLSVSLNPVVVESDPDYQTEPVFAAVKATAPAISFTTTDPDIWDLHNTEFGAGADAGAFANLVKLDQNARQFAAASTEHINFEAANGRITCEQISGADQLTRVRLDPISEDNSTLAVVANVNAALVVS